MNNGNTMQENTKHKNVQSFYREDYNIEADNLCNSSENSNSESDCETFESDSD